MVAPCVGGRWVPSSHVVLAAAYWANCFGVVKILPGRVLRGGEMVSPSAGERARLYGPPGSQREDAAWPSLLLP